jgi:hypothetical protein
VPDQQQAAPALPSVIVVDLQGQSGLATVHRAVTELELADGGTATAVDRRRNRGQRAGGIRLIIKRGHDGPPYRGIAMASEYGRSPTRHQMTAGSRLPAAAMARRTGTTATSTRPTTKKTVSAMIAYRNEPVAWPTPANNSGPIHDVPRSPIS